MNADFEGNHNQNVDDVDDIDDIDDDGDDNDSDGDDGGGDVIDDDNSIDSEGKYEDYDDDTICLLEAFHEKRSPIKVLAKPPNCLICIL